MSAPQLSLEVELKGGYGRTTSLASAGLLNRLQQSFEGDHLLPEIPVSFHGWVSLFSQPPISLPMSSIAFVAKP